MKTSYKLLILLAVITLTGMVSTNMLLKQQYDKIDWSNPYQSFSQRSLPTVRHIRIIGTPEYKIKVEPADKAQALLTPKLKPEDLQTTVVGDTLLITFNPNGEGKDRPEIPVLYNGPVGLVLRLPNLQSLYADNVEVEVGSLKTPQLNLITNHGSLWTEKNQVVGEYTVQVRDRAYATLRNDTCQTLRVVVKNFCQMELESIQASRIIPAVAPSGNLDLEGQALNVLLRH